MQPMGSINAPLIMGSRFVLDASYIQDVKMSRKCLQNLILIPKQAPLMPIFRFWRKNTDGTAIEADLSWRQTF
jgi:hypothetical protein